MRILVYGCGKTGSAVLRQLQKNDTIEPITADPREHPAALESGLIDTVDVTEPLTPMNLEAVIEEWSPDMILLATTSSDLALGNAPGIDLMMDSLWTELAAISSVPVILVDRDAGTHAGQ
jgi:FlaA1/EpsC-like NDP-sugar epimerase